MTRFFGFLLLAAVLSFNAGCGLCQRRDNPPPKVFVAPPPPAPVIGTPVPVGMVPAGAEFGPPTGLPPMALPGPSITPMPAKDSGPMRIESKWQQMDYRDANPRIQLNAPEPVEKDAPRKPDVQGAFPPIGQFAQAKDKAYAGLRPSAEGLDWLQSDGIQTVVQIRLPGEDDADAKKQVEDRRMRYVAFEVSPTTLTKEKADEFIKLIRDNSRQGIFLYDRDGSLAGAMWYLYLRWGEILDDDAAQLRARPLGLRPNADGQHRDMWLAVQKLLSENNP